MNEAMTYTQSLSLATIGEYPLKRLSREIARLLKQAPRYGDVIAAIVEEESTRRIQGRDSLCVTIPVANPAERHAAANWSHHVAQKFQMWAAEAPEFSAEFLAGAGFLLKLEEANRE